MYELAATALGARALGVESADLHACRLGFATERSLQRGDTPIDSFGMYVLARIAFCALALGIEVAQLRLRWCWLSLWRSDAGLRQLSSELVVNL